MADDIVGVVLVLLQEVGNARECNLVYILVDFLLCHSDTVVADSDSTFIRVEIYAYSQVA